MISRKIMVGDIRDERPIGTLVNMAGQYKSSIYFISEGRRINGKSIMGMMTLGIYPDEDVEVEIDGEDEEEVLGEIERFLSGG